MCQGKFDLSKIRKPGQTFIDALLGVTRSHENYTSCRHYGRGLWGYQARWDEELKESAEFNQAPRYIKHSDKKRLVYDKKEGVYRTDTIAEMK